MIVLLSYSINLSANNHTNLLTGERENRKDSVLIAYDDLRLANSKLVELKYEKEINRKLQQVIYNDSIIIKDYTILINKYNKDCKKAIRQRNIFIGIGAVVITTTLFFILK